MGEKKSGLKRYSVSGTVIGGKYLGEFEAASEEQAVEMALKSNLASVHLCHQCSHECEDPEIATAEAQEQLP